MRSLGRILAADSTDRSAFGDFWYEPVTSGGRLDSDSAMAVPAVYACVAYVAEDIGKAPMGMFEDLGEKGTKRAPQHPLQSKLHDSPNRYQTPLEFFEMMTGWAQLRRFAFAEIRPEPADPIGQIVPLHPDLIREETRSSGRVYLYRDPTKNGRERTILPEDALILRGRMGRSVIDEFARTSLRTEAAMERYAGFMFSRGSKHQGVVTHPKTLPDKVRTALRSALDEYSIEGPRAGRPLLLEDGLTWQDVSITSRDAQLIEQRQFGVSQVCRWFRVPPHKVFDLTRSTNNNIDRQSIDYVVDTLLGWAIRWEQAIGRDLVIPDRSGRLFFAKFNLDAYLRGDPLARAQAQALAVSWGWLTRNEVREMEDRSPLDGLDEPLTPLNARTGSGDRRGSSGAPGSGTASDPLLLMPGGDSPFLPAGATERRGHLALIAANVAERLVRREYATITKLAERAGGDTASDGFRAAVEAFYAEHVDVVARDLAIPRHAALRYTREQREAVGARGPAAMADWLEERVADLTDLALDKPEAAAA